MSATTTHWLAQDTTSVQAICLGTGRFLRSVLVPAMVGAQLKPVLIQTRGRSFLEYIAKEEGSYEVDTVQTDGSVTTERISIAGAFSLGKPSDRQAVEDYLPRLVEHGISILGVGVTEAGLASRETQAVKDLYRLLCIYRSACPNPSKKLCVVDMDNLPNNGERIRSFMEDIADDTMRSFLKDHVRFLNTMVDRITSQREGSHGLVPRCEPVPAKALVILDSHGDLPVAINDQLGVVIRTTTQALEEDIQLKLRIANGTHTAIAHALALQGNRLTSVLSEKNGMIYMNFLDALVEHQIIPGAAPRNGAEAVYQDWRARLVHAHFGLSTFFITQNGTSKGGIRWGPTVKDLIASGTTLQCTLAFCYAALLRWLTPIPARHVVGNKCVGWLEGHKPHAIQYNNEDPSSEQYANGLCWNQSKGWYEFLCPLDGLSKKLSECIGQQPAACIDAVRSYFVESEGGDLAELSGRPELDELIRSTAVLYARMVAGDSLTSLLEELNDAKHGVGFTSPCQVLGHGGTFSSHQGRCSTLHYQPHSTVPTDSQLMDTLIDDGNSLRDTVITEVQEAQVVDLHTHLLPPTHGSLCLWGIDELLTYHYLVAEYFMTAPATMEPEDFYAMSKKEQADTIWKALFLDRSPLSEACRGVLTTLKILGLTEYIEKRDLNGIRHYYHTFRSRGLEGSEDFCEMIFAKAGIRYAIMTNIPFDAHETQYWKPKLQHFSPRLRSALRVDPLLSGDRATIEASLRASGYDVTIIGARQYLRDWCDTMKPEYMMASTPHNFVLREGTLANVRRTGVDLDTLKEPFAFVEQVAANCVTGCDGIEDEAPSAINESSDFLSQVLMKVCQERDLPVALKIGAHRGVNPRLKEAGDGVVAFADAGMLGRLCARFPKVRFLATFLSRNNQHEACVLATKFRNLHVYGCWWFCNNPSIIEEITRMRIEMLGTSFTAQHSDARVFDQLLYKWSHSRALIAECLASDYQKSIQSGWKPTRREIRREVNRLFGGCYEEFMRKSFVKE